MKILITGGAGYVGSLLTAALLPGHHVVVYDNFVYGGHGLLPVASCPRLTVVEGDIRDAPRLRDASFGCDKIVHLAAIVGYPACDRSYTKTITTNTSGTGVVVNGLRGKPVIYGSTQSVYGKQVGIVDESTLPNPLTSYAQSKLDAERFVLRNGGTVFRFPTLFGVSPRMRWDLLVNDFVYRAVTDGVLVVYKPSALRPVLHVQDAVKVYCDAIEGIIDPGLHNIGREHLVITKKELCEEIQAQVDCEIVYKDFAEDRDARDYRIDFSGCQFPVRGLVLGITELIRAVPLTAERIWRNA